MLRACLLSRFSHVQLFVTSWTVAHRAHLSMGFSRQEFWSGLPCPPPGALPDPGREHVSPVDSSSLSTQQAPARAHRLFISSGCVCRPWEAFNCASTKSSTFWPLGFSLFSTFFSFGIKHLDSKICTKSCITQTSLFVHFDE